MISKNEVLKYFENTPNRLDLIDIKEYAVPHGWLEVHETPIETSKLIDFLINSLRHVSFLEYEHEWEFREDLSKGVYDVIEFKLAQKKYNQLWNMFGKQIQEMDNFNLPKQITDIKGLKEIYSIYSEWNNQCLLLVTRTSYITVFFGTSE